MIEHIFLFYDEGNLLKSGKLQQVAVRRRQGHHAAALLAHAALVICVDLTTLT